MSDFEGTKQCPNCKLDILSANFTIHYVHCQRNFFLCSKCEKPVNYDQKTEHDRINHVTVQCNSCQLALEKYQLHNHLINQCPNRELKCQICDIDVKAADVIEHEDYCGSRTEKCKDCGEFVMLKYKSLHLDSNHTFIKLSNEAGPSPSWQYGRRTLHNFMPDFPSKNYKSAPISKRKSNESFKRPRNSDVDEWPVLSGLRTLSICEKNEDNSAASGADNCRQNEVAEDSDLMYALQVSNEINSEVWRKKVSAEDEVLKNCFTLLSENNSAMEKSVEKDLFENKTEVKEESKVGACNNDFKYLYDKHEIIKLPCEFCGNLIVSNNLILHQSRCILYLTDNYNVRSPAYKTSYFDDMEKKIACGVCNKFFRLSLLENHQLHCQRNSAKFSKNQSFSKNFKTVNLKSEPGLQNGLEPNFPQFTRVNTRSEWLSELSKSNKETQDMRNNLNHPESGVIPRLTKVMRKTRKSSSPPAR